MGGRAIPGKSDPRRARLERELRETIGEIDDEGLIFLLRQANVLIHNARAERIDREAAALETESSGPAKGVRKAAGAGADIEETEGGRAFFLSMGKVRKVLTLEELRRLVRICYSAESKSEALRQLFTVLAKERKDILADAAIRSAGSPLLEALFKTIRKTFTLKDR